MSESTTPQTAVEFERDQFVVFTPHGENRELTGQFRETLPGGVAMTRLTPAFVQGRVMNATSLIERVQEREQSLRLTIARLLDARERYPGDLSAAMAAADAQLKREPLWVELDQEGQPCAPAP